MVGTGLTLILLLSFAVYSNTVDSEYYEYTTTNEGKSMQLTAESEGQSDWFFSTNDAITWVNFSVEDAPSGSSLTIEAEGTNWSHSPSLGLEDQTYICNEPDSDYESIIETCEYSRIHSIDLNEGNGILRGRVSLDLPIRGKGYLESESFESAQVESNDLIRSAKKVITWKITIEKDGDIVSSAGILIEAEYTTHELLDIQQFKLDPFQETVYSFSALVGCFFLVLVIPLMIYFSARYREKMNEQIRTSKE